MMNTQRVLFFAVGLALVFAVNAAFAGNLVIKGSTTVLPIAQKAAEAYMKEVPSVSISISGGGSGNGIKALIDGTTDIADSSRFIKDSEVKMAVEKGAYPVPFRIAFDCIIPIVHPSNSIENLTLDQLRAVYKGEVKNWKDIGGPDRKVVVISRDTSSGTYEVWNEKVMKKDKVYPGAVVQAVAKNQNAIGYIGLGYLNEDVKAVMVDGIEGSKVTTLDGSFPISRPLYMFTRGWPDGDTIKFINYVLDPQKGQPLVEASGYVPLY
jgi:phosphate transport system substrate-binding protein